MTEAVQTNFRFRNTAGSMNLEFGSNWPCGFTRNELLLLWTATKSRGRLLRVKHRFKPPRDLLLTVRKRPFC